MGMAVVSRIVEQFEDAITPELYIHHYRDLQLVDLYFGEKNRVRQASSIFCLKHHRLHDSQFSNTEAIDMALTTVQECRDRRHGKVSAPGCMVPLLH